jgi:membrane fusion protein (multidrug efflux system)
VVDAGNKAALRTLQLGDWVGSDWMVLSGLAAGDRVIVDNLLKVRPGAAVEPHAPAAIAPATPDTRTPAAATPAPPAK